MPKRAPHALEALRRLATRLLAAVVPTTLLLTVPVAPTFAAACPAGVWPYHQARAGGCGYGQWQKGIDSFGRAWFKLNGTVGDSAADGSCARVEVKTRVQWAPDTNQTFRVCGNGETTPIRFSDLDTASGLTGSVQAWSVRLCVGESCTAFRDFRP